MEIKYSQDGDLAIFDGLKFRRDKRTGYYLNAKTHCRLHRYVYEYYNGVIPKGYCIHHKDEDKGNNSIENLTCIPRKLHASFHSAERVANDYQWFVDNIRNRAQPEAKKWHKSEAGREWHKKHAEKSVAAIQPTQHICEQCGKPYMSVEHGNNKFCSNRCKAAYRRKMGFDNEERTCAWCGNKFVTNKYSKARTCSRSCRGYLRWLDAEIDERVI